MNRDSYNERHLMRLNNTKVTLVNAEKQEFICGYVRLLDVTPSDVTVTCNTRIRVRSEQVIVSKSLTVESLNITELGVCYLPLRGKHFLVLLKETGPR